MRAIGTARRSLLRQMVQGVRRVKAEGDFGVQTVIGIRTAAVTRRPQQRDVAAVQVAIKEIGEDSHGVADVPAEAECVTALCLAQQLAQEWAVGSDVVDGKSEDEQGAAAVVTVATKGGAQAEERW